MLYKPTEDGTNEVSLKLQPEDSAQPGHCVSRSRVRNLTAFWILGFCNNFTFWVLITAAFDILARNVNQTINRPDTTASLLQTPSTDNISRVDWLLRKSPIELNNDTFAEQCSTTSTGSLLVAETLPASVITLAAPVFLRSPTNLRVSLLIALCLASYAVLAFSGKTWLDFAGVTLASLSRGLSDITFLEHSAAYEKNVLSTWSSGTGVATFVGPLLYAGLTTCGLQPRHALLSLSPVPLLIGVSFWFILVVPEGDCKLKAEKQPIDDICSQISATKFLQKISEFVKASYHIIPLFFFYVEMYFMSSGVLELIYFPGIWLSHSQQYRWYTTIRCLGQMISRSGHCWFHTTHLWLPVIAHAFILLIMLLEACIHFLPQIWIMFALLLIQGLLEGTQFKSTLFNIYKNVEPEERPRCLATMPVTFFPPAVISGFLAIPLHDALCQIV